MLKHGDKNILLQLSRDLWRREMLEINCHQVDVSVSRCHHCFYSGSNIIGLKTLHHQCRFHGLWIGEC